MRAQPRSILVTLLLAVLLALGVAACGSSTGSGGLYNNGGAASPASS